MKRILMLMGLSAFLLPASLLAQSLNIDKLEKQNIGQAKMEVGFSTLLEGTVSDPNLEVFVFVHQPHLNAWRAFPAVTEFKPEAPGRYRWRAICHFGELNGTGIGNSHQVKVLAFDHATAARGLPPESSASAVAKVKTNVIVLKRVK